jgi:hypothetical protein
MLEKIKPNYFEVRTGGRRLRSEVGDDQEDLDYFD